VGDGGNSANHEVMVTERDTLKKGAIETCIDCGEHWVAVFVEFVFDPGELVATSARKVGNEWMIKRVLCAGQHMH
jgi:hypothetical protein